MSARCSGRGIALLLMLLGNAASAGAAELRLGLGVPDGAPIASQSVTLRAGEEHRLTRRGIRLDGASEPLDALLRVSLREEGAVGVTLELHGVLRPSGSQQAIAWTSRTYRLKRGESAAFRVEAKGGASLGFEAELLGLSLEPRRGDQARLELTLLVELVEVRALGAEQPLEARRVRLAGPEPTRVVIESGPEQLTLVLTPVSRDDEGAVVGLRLEGEGQAVTRGSLLAEARLELGWEDEARIEALAGRGKSLVVALRAER